MTTPTLRPTRPAEPVASVLRITQTRRTLFVTVQCTFCGRPHTHGAPEGATLARTSHCRRPELRGTYVIGLPATPGEAGVK